MSLVRKEIIMSDNELDEILEEIRKYSETKSIPTEPVKAEEPDAPTEPAITPEEPKAAPQPTVEKVPPVFEAPKEPKAPEAPSTEPVASEDETDIFEIIGDVPSEKENEVPEIENIVETEPEEVGLNVDNFISHTDETAPEEEEFDDSKKPAYTAKRRILVYTISAIILLAIIFGVYFGVIARNDKAEAPSTAAPATEVMTADKKRGPINPLTGEEGYNEAALTQRPVAVVVENEYSTESVRPQWGMNQADIVLEGESEYSTRTLLFWADYTKVPSQVGPTRSARPPFIRFSQLFDSIFIHAGLSHSKGEYEGADTVFENENIDHINLLKYSEDGKYFGRDYTRTSTVEHTGYLNGDNITALLESAKIDTQINTEKFTILNFNKKAQKLSDTEAKEVNFTWSDVYSSGKCPKVGKYYYDEESKKYTTDDFDSKYGDAELKFENLIFLLDETEYVVKANYKGSGNSETYCNYALKGGDGVILSEGTALNIKWSVKNKKLVLETADGKEVKLNPGKSYIGYGSSNHGGKITLNPKSDDSKNSSSDEE